MNMQDKLNVSGMNFRLMTHEMMDKISSGEVKEEGIPTFKSKYDFNLPEDGLFSEKIFGVSQYSGKGKGHMDKSNGIKERYTRFGHINTPMYINPLLFSQQNNILQRVLTFTKTTNLNNILKYKNYLIFVNSDHPSYTELALDNNIDKIDFVFPPKKLKGIFLTVPIQNFSSNIKSSAIRNKIQEIKNDDGVAILAGAYAIAFLLSKMDFKTELKRTVRLLNIYKDIINRGEQLSTNQKITLTLASERYNCLSNFIENGIEPIDLVSNRLLVIPAGWRDISLIKDNAGGVKPTKPKINNSYSQILSQAKNINTQCMFSFTLEDIFSSKDITWTKEIPSLESTFVNACMGLDRAIEDLFKNDIIQYVGVKKGKNRQAVLVKRLDFTSRSVITPDPTLQLDEIAIPIYTILEFYKSRLKELSKSAESYNKLINHFTANENLTQLRMSREETNSNLGNNFVNIVANKNQVIEDQISLIEELNNIIKEHRIVSVRFPSLHRYSMQGFKMKISFDNTVHLHPLVCKPYNADFDGDTMSQYLVETEDAINEIDEKMLPSKNLLDSNGKPMILPSQDAILGTYWLTLRDKNKGDKPIKKYSCYEHMYTDYDNGKINLHDVVEVKLPRYDNSLYNKNYYDYQVSNQTRPSTTRYSGIEFFDLINNSENKITQLLDKVPETESYICKEEQYVKSTVGRFILNAYIPQDLGYVDRNVDPYALEIDASMDKDGKAGFDSSSIKKMITKAIDTKSIEEVKFILDGIKHLGYSYATKSGMSISIGDIYVHPDKAKVVGEAQKKVEEIENKLENKVISEEAARLAKIGIWEKANDDMADRTMNDLPDDNPIKMMSISGSRGNKTQITQLMSMRGLMANTSGDVIETPVLSSFIDGLTMAEYFIGSYGTRKGMFDRSNKTKEPGMLTRRAVYGNSDMIISDGDCGDSVGFRMYPLYSDRKIHTDEAEVNELIKTGKLKIEVGDRIFGKIVLDDLYDLDNNLILKAGQTVSRKHIKPINEAYRLKGVRVRTPMTCKNEIGICAKCYGEHLGMRRFARIGDAVGVVAAQTIGEPGTQLTMRTFHTGGVAKGDVIKGFAEVSELLETKALEEYIEKDKKEIIKLSKQIEEINKIKERTINNILKYKEVKSELIEPSKLRFDDFGVMTGDLYENMERSLKEEIQSIYLMNGVEIADVHFEVIARSMGYEFEVIYPGDSVYEIGNKINWSTLVINNIGLVEKGKEPMIVMPNFKSLKARAESLDNPLLAAFFQNLTRGLANAISYNGKVNLHNPILPVAVSNYFISPDTSTQYQEIVDKQLEQPIETMDERMDRFGITMTPEVVETEKAEEVTTPDFGWKTFDKETSVESEANKSIIEDAKKANEEALTSLTWSTDTKEDEQGENVVEDNTSLEDESTNSQIESLKSLFSWETGNKSEEENKDYSDEYILEQLNKLNGETETKEAVSSFDYFDEVENIAKSDEDLFETEDYNLEDDKEDKKSENNESTPDKIGFGWGNN